MSKPTELNVFLERRSSRTFVGKLSKNENGFVFEYDKAYAYAENSIPVGPDLPITKRVHKSEQLFQSFADRIPSKKNPAYAEYCAQFNIALNEKDEIVLLSTIGKRGPSSFVFEANVLDEYSAFDYIRFRKGLGLTLRDFAVVFSASLTTLTRMEQGEHDKGRELLKRIEIYDKIPAAAIYELNRNGSKIHSAKKEKLEKLLNEKVEYIKKKKVTG